MAIRLGDHAPEFHLLAVDREPYSLSEVIARGRNVLVVFLRHLG